MNEHHPKYHLILFNKYIKLGIPFTFIRFSDGEIEILKNRYLEISNGKTIFKGKNLNNNFPKYDEKIFNPEIHKKLRSDLIESAIYKSNSYYKGIPTTHNNALEDKNYLINLNGDSTYNLTYSDLLINSNYFFFRKKLLPTILKQKNLVVIANYRSILNPKLEHIKLFGIPDNFFNNYENISNNLLNDLLKLPTNSIILSSASSLSNILGHKINLVRNDLTFIDIGTSINDLLGLNTRSRLYHQVLFSRTLKEKILALIYRFSKEYTLKW